MTREGYVFAAPRASSLYVPVVTGSYRPPFPADYTGNVREYIDRRKREIDERIAELERSKYPVYRREQANDRDYREFRRKRIKRRWWKGESAEAFDKRVEELLAQKAAYRRATVTVLVTHGGTCADRFAAGVGASETKNWRKATKIS